MSDPETKPAVPEQSVPAETPVAAVVETPKVETAPAIPATETSEAPSEKALLMDRAKLMGIKFSNNISVEKLKAKIVERMKEPEEPKAPRESPSPSLPSAPVAQFAPRSPVRVPPEMAKQALPDRPETFQEIRDRLVREKMKLVRLRITNLDPKKKNIPGEIITVGNKYIGTVKKFIPFGDATDGGYHVPYCIYQMLKARRFLHIRVIKSKNGRGDHIETSYVPEFALEVLPPLTEKELKDLARMQAAKKGNGED